MIRLFVAWLLGRDPSVVHGWTPARAQQLERQTLEAAGVAGFHFSWSRRLLRAPTTEPRTVADQRAYLRAGSETL